MHSRMPNRSSPSNDDGFYEEKGAFEERNEGN